MHSCDLTFFSDTHVDPPWMFFNCNCAVFGFEMAKKKYDESLLNKLALHAFLEKKSNRWKKDTQENGYRTFLSVI